MLIFTFQLSLMKNSKTDKMFKKECAIKEKYITSPSMSIYKNENIFHSFVVTALCLLLNLLYLWITSSIIKHSFATCFTIAYKGRLINNVIVATKITQSNTFCYFYMGIFKILSFNRHTYI